MLFSFSRTTNDWVNPASVGLVVVNSSEGRALPYGKLEDVVSRDAAALNCHTNDDKYGTISLSASLNLDLTSPAF